MAYRWVGRIVFVVLAGAVGLAQAPAPQQTPVFRGGTTVVPLTVTVLDKNGAPVKDLRESDFTVYENKRPREILNFYPQAFEPGPVQPTAPAVNRIGDNRVIPQTRRTFLIVLGYGRIQHPTNALDGAMEFVRKKLLPQDAVAVMGFHRTTEFTTDHEQIAQILDRYKKAHEKIVFEIDEFRFMSRSPVVTPGTSAGASAPPGGAPIPDQFLKMIDEIFTGPAGDPGSKDPGLHRSEQALALNRGAQDPGRQLIPLRNTADLLFSRERVVPVVEKPGQHQETLSEVLKGLRDSGDEPRDEVLLSTRLKLYAGIEYLRYVDGEKHMLFFAGGGLARNADDAKVVAQRATDARVVVDLVATGGTARNGRSDRAPDHDVTDLTGGSYTSVDMATKAVAKIDQATRFSYLLGYAPSNPTLDGRYRDVEVKVNRPDVTVRFSHGYYAAAQPEPLALKELIIKSRLDMALAYDSQAKDIKLGVTTSLLPRMGIQSMVRAEITIDASQLAFSVKDGIHTGQLELQVYCADAKQAIIGEFGERLDLEASDATHAQWLQTGIRRIVRVPVIGEPKFVKVIVYDYGSDRVGSFMLKLTEPGR